MSNLSVPLPKAFDAKVKDGKVYVESPKVMCVYSAESAYMTYEFLSLIESYVFDYNVGVTISFENLEYFSAAASLLIFATVSKCQIGVKDHSKIEVLFPKNDAVLKLMASSGLKLALKQGGIAKVRKLIDSNNQYLSGSEVSIENYQKVLTATLLNLDKHGVNFSNTKSQIFVKGMQEAILNVKYHAYNDEFIRDFLLTKQVKSKFSFHEETGRGRWWQCCWHDVSNNKLIFIIYDDGEGIVNSIKRYYRNSPEHSDKLNLPDSTLLGNAMKLGVSRTGIKERGKGSADIINTACTFPSSHLIVMSGLGHYRHDSAGINTTQLPFEIKGTLVQWVINYVEENQDDI